jgi:hypothetical protein
MMHLEFFFDGRRGCKRILRTQGRNSWILRFLTENKFLSNKPLKIARQYLASARLIRVKQEKKSHSTEIYYDTTGVPWLVVPYLHATRTSGGTVQSRKMGQGFLYRPFLSLKQA